MNAPDTNGWSRAEKYVFEELQRLSSNIETLHGRVTEVKVEMGRLQVKSGVWGLVGGALLLLPVLLFKLWK